MLRSASSSAASSLSSPDGVLRAASAVARHRSLQYSSRRTSPRRSASRWASVASSAPCAVPYARSSVAPSRIWCSSRASSPRAHAMAVARVLPRASACMARASQAMLRGSGGPRRRDRAARSRCGSAWATLPGSARSARRAGAPASPRRPGRVETGGDLLGVPQQGHGMLARGVPGLGQDEAGTRLQWSRSCVRNSRRARRAFSLASPGRPAARAAVAAAKSTSAFLYAIPPFGGIWLERGHGLLRCFFGQPGGQQGRAAIDDEIEVGLAERVVTIPCFVETGERLGKISADKRHTSAVVPSLGVLEFLPAGGVHLLGPGVVRSRATRQAELEEDRGSMCQ